MLVPFGKYRGEDYTILIKDESYYNWCKLNKELQRKYAIFFKYLENPIEIKTIKEIKYKLTLGAIDKATNNYVLPCNADKKNKYVCPDCSKDLIFKNGKIKAPHFAHFSEKEPCTYYIRPTESQIHKDAKLLLKSLLDIQKKLLIIQKCSNGCNIEYPIEYTENKTELEYRFDLNNSTKIADVAFLNMNKIKYIFEICHKHKTLSENRPEPWFEFNATDLIETVNINIENDTITLQCIRGDQTCQECLKIKEMNKEITVKCYKEDCNNHIIKSSIQNECCLICKPKVILWPPKLKCINYVLCKNRKYLQYSECSSCYDKRITVDIEHYCNARIFNEHYHLDNGKLKIKRDKDFFGMYDESCYFGGRCKLTKINGTKFCKIHSIEQPYGIWDGEYTGTLKILIDELVNLFIANIDISNSIDDLDTIKEQLYDYKNFIFYNDLIDKINTKISLFETEITKYEELLIPIINNREKLQVLLEDIKNKPHLYSIQKLIECMSSIDLSNTIEQL